jgi:VWFA-related protein
METTFMRTSLVAATSLVVALAVPGAAQQPTFPSRVELVTVDVVVFDRQGNPVEGLTREDFTIREDGQPQTIAAFEAVSLLQSSPAAPRVSRISTNAETPDAAARWFFVVFDDVNITQFSTPRARETVVQFIEQALRPGDRVMIAPASGGSNWIGELPRDREYLLTFVQRLQGERRVETGPGRIWDYEAMGIALGRDKQAEAQVVRRYFENDIIIDAAAVPSNPAIRSAVDADPGVAMVRAKARQTYAEARSRMQTSLGTLERMAEALADARGRKTLLFLSEGFIMDPTLPNFRTLLQAARNANVAIHFVDVGNPGGPIGQAGLAGSNAETARAVEDRDATLGLALIQRESDGARSIAADTGGRTISGSSLLDGLRRVANEGRAYYLLGYSPTSSRRDGRFRKIEVTLPNRPEVTVRARGGYFEAASDRLTSRPGPTALNPEVRAGLDSPFGAPGIPMRMTSYVFGPQTGTTVRTLLVAEADPTPLRLAPRNGRYSATLESYVLVHDRSRDSLERNERLIELNVPAESFARLAEAGIPVQREFALAPGTYQATLLLHDRETGTIGSVRHEFDVPGPDQFRITTPIVTDIVQPPSAGGQPSPVPIARRRFKAGTRIAAAFEIIGAAASGNAPQVSVSYALRRADGTPVSASPPQALMPNARGQFAVAIGISLPPDAAGGHQLALSVRDEQAVRVIEHVEPIEIVP